GGIHGTFDPATRLPSSWTPAHKCMTRINMQRNDVMHVLNDPLAQELIRIQHPRASDLHQRGRFPARGATLLVQLTLAHSSTAARRHVLSQLSSKTDCVIPISRGMALASRTSAAPGQSRPPLPLARP